VSQNNKLPPPLGAAARQSLRSEVSPGSHPTSLPHAVGNKTEQRRAPQKEARLSRMGGATDPADFVINRILDLEAQGEVHEAAALLAEQSLHDPTFADRFSETHRVLSQLKSSRGGLTRDLSDAIIERVEQQRVYLPRKPRRRIGAWRTGFASAGLCGLAVVGLLQLRSPDVVDVLTHGPVAIAERVPEVPIATSGGPGMVHHLARGLEIAADTLAATDKEMSSSESSHSSLATRPRRTYDPMRDIGTGAYDGLSLQGSSLTLGVNSCEGNSHSLILLHSNRCAVAVAFPDSVLSPERTNVSGLFPALSNLHILRPSESHTDPFAALVPWHRFHEDEAGK
jgi:hypothetical protein